MHHTNNKTEILHQKLNGDDMVWLTLPQANVDIACKSHLNVIMREQK